MISNSLPARKEFHSLKDYDNEKQKKCLQNFYFPAALYESEFIIVSIWVQKKKYNFVKTYFQSKHLDFWTVEIGYDKI